MQTHTPVIGSSAPPPPLVFTDVDSAVAAAKERSEVLSLGEALTADNVMLIGIPLTDSDVNSGQADAQGRSPRYLVVRKGNEELGIPPQVLITRGVDGEEGPMVYSFPKNARELGRQALDRVVQENAASKAVETMRFDLVTGAAAQTPREAFEEVQAADRPAEELPPDEGPEGPPRPPATSLRRRRRNRK